MSDGEHGHRETDAPAATRAGGGAERGGEAPPPVRPRRLALPIGVAVALLLGIGIVGRIDTDEAADATVRTTDLVPTVAVATARRDDAPMHVALPGETEPFDVASLYPRATGYVVARRVDIGSRVTKGELLLRIAAPDTDAELGQAVAQVGQIEASLVEARDKLRQALASAALANVTSRRSTTLAREGWTPRQTADNDAAARKVQTEGVGAAQAGIALAEADLRARQATVARLRALVGFEEITAPFDGVITTRAVDVGDLLDADSTTGGTPLFTEAADDVLRVEVYVPQSQAIGVRDGIAARVSVPEMPGCVFPGRVARTAVMVANASRSMLTEIDIPNPTHLLKPGLYVNVAFDVPRRSPVVTVPDAAVIFDGGGLQVATVSGGRAHLRPITIGRDLGTVAELSAGLAGGEQVIVNPPADLTDGEAVRVSRPRPPGTRVPAGKAGGLPRPA